MERVKFRQEAPIKSLQERLIDAALYPQSLAQRRMEGSDLPRPMKIAKQNSSETFVRLVERVAEFQQATSKTRAKNILAHSAQLGRRLDEILRDNDEGVSFIVTSLSFLEIANPGLAEDVGKIIQKAWDEKRFKDER